MKLYRTLIILAVAITSTAFSQDRELETESAVMTQHEVMVKGKRFPYQATAGTQPVWDKDGKAIASLFYTYYERTDIKDRAARPLLISFNGGPGSASVWMHLGYTGPRVLRINDEGYPIQPYGVKENPNSVLDVADIVYVNPVNTGFSRIVKQEDDKKEKVEKSTFFGVNADIKYLAEWISAFVSRKNRWRSPKYLIGESYGTTRVAGLALELQKAHWMYLNGVILVSPTDIGIERGGSVKAALKLPYFTAAAWYHKVLNDDLQQRDLEDILPEVENYTIKELIPAMAEGGFLQQAKKKEIAARMAYYSGVSEKTFLQYNLDVPTRYFWKELLRNEGYTVGRLDSRYLGLDKNEGGSRPDYSAELTSWLHSFTPAINYYLREELNYKTDIKYNMFGPVRPWDRRNNRTGENLRAAVAMNPYLHVMIQSGYYDGATQYFNAKYTLWHLDPSGKLKDRLRFEAYRSGHMMYLRAEDLASSNEHLREFIRDSMPAEGIPAQYKVK
ncbi:carboxypeptidase [candidate division KSB1 bacterium]|nr:carboxypeptidase [candidate division KSB1 bacterium]